MTTEAESKPLQRTAGSWRWTAPPLEGWPAPADPVWFEVEGLGDAAVASAEVSAAVHLLPAMYVGRDLVVAGEVDPGWLERVPGAMERLATWFPPLYPVAVGVAPESKTPGEPVTPLPTNRRTALFVDAGLHALRCLQVCADRVDCLVHVAGFDPADGSGEDGRAMLRLRGIEELAKELGKPLVVVKTNWRRHASRIVGELSRAADGLMLASVARLLQPWFKECLFGARGGRGHREPHGLHPLVFDGWSGRQQQLSCIGADEHAWDKLAQISRWPAARRLFADEVQWRGGNRALAISAAWSLQDQTGGSEATGLAWPVQAGNGAVDTGKEGDEVADVCDAELAAQVLERATAAGLAGEPLFCRLADAFRVGEDLPTPSPRMAEHLTEPTLPDLRANLLSFERTGDLSCWELRIEWRGTEHVLWGRLRSDRHVPQVEDIADAALVWLLPLAMHLGVTLELAPELAVDSGLVGRIRRLQPSLATMPPTEGLMVAPLRVHERPVSGDHARASSSETLGSAFSGGVDGCALVLDQDPPPAVLVYLHGIDAEIQGEDRRERVEQRVLRAASFQSAPVVFVDTNLREILTGTMGVDWATVFRFGIHGAGHLLASQIDRFAIASDHSFDRLITDPSIGAGNHPALFEMLTSTRQRQEYWDNGRRRIDHVIRLGQVPDVLAHVWVCQQEAKGLYSGQKPNCGRCEKCLRTLLAMRVGGCGDGADAFDSPLDVARLGDEVGLGGDRLSFWGEIIEVMRADQERFAQEIEMVENLLASRQRSEPQGQTWITDPKRLAALRDLPGYRSWLRQHGAPLAAAVFSDQPAAWIRRWLDHKGGRKTFRRPALAALVREDAPKVERWLRRARFKRRFGLRP